MSSMDLGTARGRIILDAKGAVAGAAKAQAATAGMMGTIQRVKPKTDMVGKGMLAMGAAAAAGIGLAVNTAADFEKKMNKVAAVSGATGSDLEKLSDQAKELGSSTQFSASQAAEGMSFLSMAGFDVNETMSAMPGVLNLAAAGQLDLAEAADLASNVLTGYGLEASDINRVNDTLAATASSANTSVGQLGQAMSFVAPVANASGIEIEEASAAIGKLSDAGIQGSRAGTTLRQIIAKLEKPTSMGADAIDRLGIKTHDAEGNLVSITSIVEQFEEAGLSTADAMTIFGARAGPGLQALVDQGSDSLKELNGELQNSQGRAKEMADKQMEGLKGAFVELKSAVEGALIAVGEHLLPVFERLTDLLSSVFQAFAKLPSGVQKFIAIAGAATAIIGVLGGGALLLVGQIPKLAAGFKTLGLTMRGAFIGTGIGAVILAVAGAVYLLYQHSETFRSAVQGLFGWLKDLVGQFKFFFSMLDGGVSTAGSAELAFSNMLPEWLVGLIGDIADAFIRIRDVIMGVVDWAKRLGSGLSTMFALIDTGMSTTDAMRASLGTMLPDSVIETIAKIVDWVKEFVEQIRFMFNLIGSGATVAEGFSNAFSSVFTDVLPPGVVNAITQGIEVITQGINTLKSVFMAAFTIITQVVRAAIAVIQAIWRTFGDNILSFIKGTLNTLWGFFKGTFENIVQFLSGIFDIIKGVFDVFAGIFTGDWSRVWEGIKSIFAGIWRAIHAVFSQIVQTIITVAKQAWNIITTATDVAFKIIKGIFTTIWNAILGFLKAVWGDITETVRGAINGAKSIISSVLSTIKSIWTGAWDTVKSTLSGAWDTITSTVSDKIDEVLGFFRDLPGDIVSKLGDLGSLLLNAGKDLVRGLVNGIGDMAGEAVDAAKGVVDGAIEGAKNLLRIGSPSRVFVEMGEETFEGFRQGIRSMKRNVEDAARETTGAAVRASETAALGKTGGAGSVTNTSSSTTYQFSGNIVLPNVTDRSSADDILDGLRQAVRKGA